MKHEIDLMQESWRQMERNHIQIYKGQTKITSLMMCEILPSSTGQFLLLNQLHAIECNKTLSALLMSPILLVEGMKI
jgi:hypothetical protein